jgi:hypothetical protein
MVCISSWESDEGIDGFFRGVINGRIRNCNSGRREGVRTVSRGWYNQADYRVAVAGVGRSQKQASSNREANRAGYEAAVDRPKVMSFLRGSQRRFPVLRIPSAFSVLVQAHFKSPAHDARPNTK